MICSLCCRSGKLFFKEDFFLCPHCSGIFRNRNNLTSQEEEKKRYEQHNNDVNDPRYQQFVSPITHYVLNNFSAESAGLDFGAGNGSAISKILKDNHYRIDQYDPFFFNNKQMLELTYDYIVCCEVIEHFHHPNQEFRRLYQMLNPQGELICMTHLYGSSISFDQWYYKNDRTHVFFYQEATIEYIAKEFGFTSYEVKDRLIVWRK